MDGKEIVQVGAKAIIADVQNPVAVQVIVVLVDNAVAIKITGAGTMVGDTSVGVIGVGFWAGSVEVTEVTVPV